MREKVLQLAADHEALTRQLAARAAQVAPLAEAAHAQAAADDAAAQDIARQQAALEKQRSGRRCWLAYLETSFEIRLPLHDWSPALGRRLSMHKVGARSDPAWWLCCSQGRPMAV